jgi:hypothetical protein
MNCSSVWSGLRSSAALATHHASISGGGPPKAGVLERVLEAGREVDLGRLDLGELVEQLVGQGGRAVLDRAGQAARAGELAEPGEDVEVELDLGHAAAGQEHAAVARAGLD